MDHQIALGSLVVGADDRPVGKVTRLVVSPDNREVLEIIVRAGHLLHTDRIVEVFNIARIEAGVVQLAIPADEVSRLPRLIYHQYVIPASNETADNAYPIAGSIAGGLTAPGVWGSGYSGKGFHGVDRPFFESATIDGGAVERRSNLPDDSVALGRGVEVVDRDGRAVGALSEIIYGDRDEITAIVAASGIFHRDRVQIPAAAIASIIVDRITLTTTAGDFDLPPA